MKKYVMGWALLACMGLAQAATGGEGAAPKDIQLPPPAESLQVDLMAALKNRQATREYAEADGITAQVLSNLLWASDGVNRPGVDGKAGKRTAPFAMGVNTVRLYAVTKNGAFLYEPDGHKLVAKATADLRGEISTNAFVAKAAVVFLFTYDKALKMDRTPDDRSQDFAWNGTGAMCQNLALAAAAQKLGTVVVASVKPEAAKLVGASEGETPLVVMPVGPLK